MTGLRAGGLGRDRCQDPQPLLTHRAVVGREGDAARRDAAAGLPAALQGLPEALPQVAQPLAVVALQLLEAPAGAVDGAEGGRQRLRRWGGSEGSACLPSPSRAPKTPALGPGTLPPKRLWRDPSAPSTPLLMPETILPPRMGPMSAEMGGGQCRAPLAAAAGHG